MLTRWARTAADEGVRLSAAEPGRANRLLACVDVAVIGWDRGRAQHAPSPAAHTVRHCRRGSAPSSRPADRPLRAPAASGPRRERGGLASPGRRRPRGGVEGADADPGGRPRAVPARGRSPTRRAGRHAGVAPGSSRELSRRPAMAGYAGGGAGRRCAPRCRPRRGADRGERRRGDARAVARSRLRAPRHQARQPLPVGGTLDRRGPWPDRSSGAQPTNRRPAGPRTKMVPRARDAGRLGRRGRRPGGRLLPREDTLGPPSHPLGRTTWAPRP